MLRHRRRTCITLGIFVLIICFVMMGLKTLRPDSAAFGSPFGLGLLPDIRKESNLDTGRRVEAKPEARTRAVAPRFTAMQSEIEELPPPNYDLHVFYYMWYGNPQFDGKYLHWNHKLLKHWDAKTANNYPTGVHAPPDDVGANFFPQLGPYSSRDPSVIDAHMKQIRSASIGVLSISWYPPGMSDENGQPWDDLVPAILDAAHRYSLKVTFHIEPYTNRDDRSLRSNVVYIIDKYGSHPAFYRYKTSTGRTLPLFYIYDSYITSPDIWANLLTISGSESVRNTPYDGIFIALIVDEKHKYDIHRSGFDGLYTYFATNGFSFGSSHNHWSSLKAFCDTNNLIFIPSVGPGYIDTSIRPWNFQNTRKRINGKYYETSLNAALTVRPSIISITSFNEWHEGTQIEEAVPMTYRQFKYEDYLPHKPNIYLQLTRKWSEKFTKEKDHWLV